MSQKGVLPPHGNAYPEASLRESTELIDYISAEGVMVRIFMPHEPERKAALTFRYEPDRYLIDKLWDAGYHQDENISYEDFLRKFRGYVTVKVQVSTAADDPAIAGIPARPAFRAMDPNLSFDTALNWLNDCQAHHTQCKRSGILPTRVIDIGTRFPIRSVRLHWSEEGEEGQYAALSYCWGGLQPLATTRTTAQDITDGIIFSKLLKTLQDAMIVTSKLGLRYIWIDSLCIIQDDTEDVAREIARMAQIYQEAFVTISAASSASVHEGFLSGRQSSRDPPLQLPLEAPGGYSGTVLVQREQRAYNHGEDPINLRAWTLQEHVLATRMLVFGTGELWWTCEGATTFHPNSAGRINHLVAMQRKSDRYRFSLEYWRSIVRDYSRRFLTYPNDKLPAIAGVAAQYGQNFHGRYLAGLWEFGFLSELMWCSNRSDISRPLVQRAPSWSWASVDGEIHHNWCPFDLGVYAPRVISCYVSPVSPVSPYGCIDPTRSTLQIAGDLARVYWLENREYIYCTQQCREQYNGVDGVPVDTGWYNSPVNVGRTQADAPDNLLEEDEDGRTIVWVFPIVRNPIRGLLLTHLDGDKYRRVGLVLRLWNEELMFGRFEAKTITIL